MSKKYTTPKARREAGETLKTMAEQLDGAILVWWDGIKFVITTESLGDVTSYHDMDHAFINALHKQAGTKPPPF